MADGDGAQSICRHLANSFVQLLPSPPTTDGQDITRFIKFKLDATSGNYNKWRNFLLIALSKLNARDQVEEEPSPHLADDAWRAADADIVLWIYTTISDELQDIMLEPVTATPAANRATWLVTARAVTAPSLGTDNKGAAGVATTDAVAVSPSLPRRAPSLPSVDHPPSTMPPCAAICGSSLPAVDHATVRRHLWELTAGIATANIRPGRASEAKREGGGRREGKGGGIPAGGDGGGGSTGRGVPRSGGSDGERGLTTEGAAADVARR